MPDTEISSLAQYGTVHGQDLLLVVDTTDTSMAITGTDKKSTINQLLVGMTVSSGNISVASTNGFAGTVASPLSSPIITLSTSVNGIIKGNGTAMSPAVSGADYQPVISLTTNGTSGPASFNGQLLNIPQYSGGGGGTVGPGVVGQISVFLTSSTIGSSLTGIPINSHFGGYGVGSIIAGSANFNAATNDKWQLLLNIPTTSLVVNNASSGQILALRLIQDTTGNRTVNWNSVGNITWIGTPGYIPPVLGASSGAVSKVYLEYLGNNSYDGFTSGASNI